MAVSEKNNVLDRINSPEDLKGLTAEERSELACEIRKYLIDVISENGGHLAPNLGVVELTIALHTVFNTPADKLVWDVSHQGYVHKLLTGRREMFKTLRRTDGCSGFLSREESEYDVFGAGHAGTAISAAVGFAAARDAKGDDNNVIAVVGDGALNCGVSLEGLNNVAEVTDRMIIVLNDNKMSISPNVGSMARYLNRMISARPYNRFKAFARSLVRKIPLVGDAITHKISRLEEAAKSIFVPGVIFEELGLRYIGPVDGHNVEELIRTFDVVREFERPTVVHVLTEKGRGYQPAEAAPEKFHGLGGFDPDTGLENKKSGVQTFSSAFGAAVCELAEKQSDVVAVTAAMRSGTGLTEFAEKFPDRYYDVGIAEEHAVVFAAAMAAEGVRPVVAIYSTFMQRALDYVIHDVALQKLPVIFCTDRAGIVDDGPTHHGIHDIAFLKVIPGVAILAPKDECELRNMLFAVYQKKVPAVIRYPRGSGSDRALRDEKIEWGRAEMLSEGKDVAIWAMGREVFTAMQVAELLKKHDLSAVVVNVRFIKPLDSELLIKHAENMPVVTIEDCQKSAGLASLVDEVLADSEHQGVQHFGWGDEFVPHGAVAEIREKEGMTAEKIAEAVMVEMNKKDKK